MAYLNVYDMVDSIASKVERFVGTMDLVHTNRETLGLDERCGFVFVNEDSIAVPKHGVGRLEYYGGFEYVDKEYRHELGDYVFYTADDDRVQEAIDNWYHYNSETNICQPDGALDNNSSVG